MENFDWGSFIFYALLGWLAMRITQGYLEHKNQELQNEINLIRKKVKEKIVLVKIEKHQDTYYIFESETDSFVAQGKTVEELKEAMHKRYPDKTFMASEEHLKEIGLTL